jgi:hypothetical protein
MRKVTPLEPQTPTKLHVSCPKEEINEQGQDSLGEKMKVHKLTEH